MKEYGNIVLEVLDGLRRLLAGELVIVTKVSIDDSDGHFVTITKVEEA